MAPGTAMRIALLLAAVGLITVASAPVAAQTRDPFDPLVSTGSATTDDTGTSTSTDTPTDASTVTSSDTVIDESSLPNTGNGVTEWLVVAYALIAIGAGFVVMARVLSQAQKKDR
jgi:hypothetical protein